MDVAVFSVAAVLAILAWVAFLQGALWGGVTSALALGIVATHGGLRRTPRHRGYVALGVGMLVLALVRLTLVFGP